MKIYITRHGETEWNKKGLMQGRQNSNLSEKGIENAKRLGKSLNDINFDVVYSSPLVRAVDTTNYILGERKAKIILLKYLEEMAFGIWEGLEHSKIKEMYPERYVNFWEKPHLYDAVKDGENFRELLLRVNMAWNQILSSTGDNILVVTHAVVLKALYVIIKKIELEYLWNPPFMKDTSLTVVEVTENNLEIVLEADISHLE